MAALTIVRTGHYVLDVMRCHLAETLAWPQVNVLDWGLGPPREWEIWGRVSPVALKEIEIVCSAL